MGCKQVNSKEQKVPIKVEDKSTDPQKEKKIEEGKKEPVKEATEYIIQILQNSKLVWQNTFSVTMTASQVIDQFINEKPEYKVNASTKFFINDCAELVLSKTLKELQPYTSSNYEIRFCFESKGINLPLNLLNAINDGLDFVGKLLLNPFQLVIFSKTHKSLEVYPISETMVSDYILKLYTSSGACCNGGNFLYLSGGERDGQLESHVWSINLKTKDITVTNEAMLPKKHHSMIFISPHYVFIVGGNTRDAFYYDISKNVFVNWGQLNVERLEPALSLIDNHYLYCFSYMSSNLSFERTDLTDEPKWQSITPKLSSRLQFTQKYFGVVHESGSSSLIFVGGCMINKSSNEMCFKYNTESNELSESLMAFTEQDLIEKTFVSLSNNKWSVLIPNCVLNNLSILLFNSYTQEITNIQFQEGDQGIVQRKRNLLSQSLLVDISQINFNMPVKS